MAVGNIRAIIPGRNQKGAGSHTSDVQDKAASAMVRGAPLEYVSGDLTEHGSPIAASEQVVGFTCNSRVAGDAQVRFYGADQEFEGTLQNGAATYTLVKATAMGVHVYLAKDSGLGIWYLDLQDPGSGLLCARVVAFRDDIGTVDPRVFFKLDTDVIFPAT